MSHEFSNNSFPIEEPCLSFVPIWEFTNVLCLIFLIFPLQCLLFYSFILGHTYKREHELFRCDMLSSLLLPRVLGLSQPAALVATSQCILLLSPHPSALHAFPDGNQSAPHTESLSRALVIRSHFPDPRPHPGATEDRLEILKFRTTISKGISTMVLIWSSFHPSHGFTSEAVVNDGP